MRATSRPSNQTSPAVGSIRRSTQRPVVLLPQPDSPTRPSVSPGGQLEADAVDRMHVVDHAAQQPAADREVLLQVLDLQQRRDAHLAPKALRAVPRGSERLRNSHAAFTSADPGCRPP